MDNLPGLLIGVSTREDGNMAEKWGNKEEVNKNRQRFSEKLGIKFEDCVIASLELGTRVRKVGSKDRGKYIDCDALVTGEPGLGLWMVTADCYATVIYDPVNSILGLVHLGRQGLDGGIINNLVRELQSMGSLPEKLIVWAGPGLKKDSYVWNGNLPMKTDWGKFVVKKKSGTWLIDMEGMLRNQFSKCGIKRESIHVSPADVYADKRYFSHVRSVRTGEPEGRFATVAMLR